MAPKLKPLLHKYGRLTVIGERQKHGRYWLVPCRCDCGTEKMVDLASLRSGSTISCGCYRNAAFLARKDAMVAKTKKHGQWQARTYRIWLGMRARCSNPNITHYARYGGRGIRVCERWQSFENFLADMGEAPPGHSLDRIDNDGHYEPSNCRWATQQQQMDNTAHARRITINGETKSFRGWARHLGLSVTTLYTRLERGWSLEDAVTRGYREGGRYCSRGHEYTPENTRLYGTTRICKACRRMHAEIARLRRKLTG